MQARRFGRIVNITSGTVKLPQAGLDLSSAARGGLTIFLAGVARQVAASNVTINNLLPGAFETDRLKTVLGNAAKRKGLSYEDAKAERIASIPAKRLGDLDGFGATCAFLCSAQAGFITGQNLMIDGGAYPGVF
jgi:3-oxoacyl-[acyl-carrier protein] reductase